jgi:uncharacterized protein HemX
MEEAIMRQRGFIAYALLGMLAVTVGAGAWAWLQGKRLEAAQAELSVCRIHYEDALGLIQQQNEAVQGLKKAATEAQERARKAEASAKEANKGLTKERERLAALGKKPPPGPCPAGQAVKRVREGLR